MWDEDVNAPGDARLASDEAVTFEAEDHLVDGRWSDTEVPLHVGFGRGLAEHALVDADEGEILALLLSEAMRGAGQRGA